MLLPQNLEPFIVIENSSISYAFDQTTEEYVKQKLLCLIAHNNVLSCSVILIIYR